MAEEPSPKSKASPLKVFLIIAGYWAISISLVFANKILVSESSTAHVIPAPIFVTWYQCVLTVVILFSLGQLRAMYPDSILKEFPVQQYKLDVGMKILPLSCIFVGMMSVSNLCLKHVEVSFYQVARSLTLLFNVVFSYLILSITTSPKTCACIGVVIMGFYMGVEGEVNFSLTGTIFGVSSSFLLALNSIYTKKSFAYVNDDHWVLVFYNNCHACLLLPLASILAGEHQIVAEHSAMFYEPDFWLLMNFSAVMGTLIGVFIVLQIQVTSPLTSVISGTAKAAAQTVLALWYFQNPMTAGAVFGLVLVLGGSTAYTIVKRMESSAKWVNAKAAATEPVHKESDDVELTPLKTEEEPNA